MATSKGKWGVTKESDGSLSPIWSWPWYWRYPAALALSAGCIWIFFHSYAGGSRDVVLWILVGLGAFISLTIAYELGCLLVTLTVIFGGYALAKTFLPDFELTLGWKLGLIWAAILYTWWWHGKTEGRVALAERDANDLRYRVRELESIRESESAEAWGDIRELRARIRKLELANEDPFANL